MAVAGTSGASPHSNRLATFARSARLGLSVTELANLIGVKRQRAHQILQERAALHDAWRRRRQKLRQCRTDNRLAAWRRTEHGAILMRAARELRDMGYGAILVEQSPGCPPHVLVGGVRLRFASPSSSFVCGSSTRYFRVNLYVEAFYAIALDDGRRCVFAPGPRRMVYLPHDPKAPWLPRSVPVVAWPSDPRAHQVARRRARRRAA